MATKYTVTTSSLVRRDVVCEKCQAKYVYAVVSEGTGIKVGGYKDQNAEQIAAAAAQVDLAKNSATAVDGVPCPGCWWYQADMVRFLRLRWHWWIRAIGVVLAVVGIVGLFLCCLLGANAWFGIGRRPGMLPVSVLNAAGVTCAALLVLGILLMSIRHRMSAGYDPNSTPEAERKTLARSRAALAVDMTPQRFAEICQAADTRRKS